MHTPQEAAGAPVYKQSSLPKDKLIQDDAKALWCRGWQETPCKFNAGTQEGDCEEGC